jgi:hypothetical protein
MPIIHFSTSTNDERLKDFCARYWQWEQEQDAFKFTVTSLAREYGESTSKFSKLVAENSRGYSPEAVCTDCKNPLLFSSRTDLLRFVNNKTTAICTACTAERTKRKEQEKAEREQRLQHIIEETYSRGSATITDIGTLSFENAIYLLAIVRFAAEEDFSIIYPLEHVEVGTSLAPTSEMLADIVRSLHKADILRVSPQSPLNAFDFEDGTKVEAFYLFRVMYLPPVDEDGSTQKLIYTLERALRDHNWPESWHAEWQALWKKIALHECLQYLNQILNEHDLPFKPGEKTLATINTVLETFSASQVFNMIWRAVVNAAAFYVRERTTKQHAANTVPGGIQSYADKASANEWEVKKYRRPPSCPQSVVSEVLYNVALGIGDEGLDCPPGTVNE